MSEQSENRLNWRLPFCGFLAAFIVLLPKLILGNDIGAFLGMAILGAVIGLALLVAFLVNIRRQSGAVLFMFFVFFAFSWLLFGVSDDVRTTGRWLFQSSRYMAEVSAQPNSALGELKHTEWDGWGFPGVGNTVVYLVFDPNDSLAPAAKSHSGGKYSGIPCKVLRVRRQESHWYTVLFYTETDWSHCSG